MGEWKLVIRNSKASNTKAILRAWHVLVHTHKKTDGGLPPDFKHYDGTE